MDKKKIVVIGGGPAGMMASIRAACLKQDIILLEKNPILGKKLLLSGKGRCNLTNMCDMDSFIERFSDNGEFLRDAFKKFFNKDLVKFFEDRNLKLKTERQMRVFPVTDRADSILNILEQELHKLGVEIRLKAKVEDVVIKDKKIEAVLVEGEMQLKADKVILSTGGVSYGFTGSTGDGFTIAKRLGHHIVGLRTGLVGLVTLQKYPNILEGLTLKNIRLKFSNGKKDTLSEIGELLFTENGISGPLVLSLSGSIVDWIKDGKNVWVEIDLKPALSKEEVDGRLLREFKVNSKKTIKVLLRNLLPAKFIDIFLECADISRDKNVSQINQIERRRMVELFKAFRLDITKSRPMEEAMITRGGVSLKEIDPRTMASRIIKGLYFAGEMIDIDADTGGFNLQAAFSTGYLAGESAAL